MNLTAPQIRGRIKNLAKENNADPRVLMRLYMMERFLERVSVSKFRDIFIIKGGVLVTSMLGVSLRSTMDIDTTIQNYDLSIENTRRMIESICFEHVVDGITFEIKSVSEIMDDMEYPGIRFGLEASIGRMVTPVKIDVSTGAAITPSAVEYEYKLMLEDRTISLLSYNIETVLAEKLQAILARGVLNTRMRDFYDVHVLLTTRKRDINNNVLKQAFLATCKSRQSESIIANSMKIYENIATDERLASLWKTYQQKYPYAFDIDFEDVLGSLKVLMEMAV